MAGDIRCLKQRGIRGCPENPHQKNVTAWLDLRNKAAHGEYGKYEADQVGLMIDGIRDFITRHPA